MKILMVIDSLGSGGAERSTEVLCDYLSLKRIDFDIICLDKRRVGIQQRILNKNYTVTFLPKGNFIFQVKALARHIELAKYDIVHSILFRSNLRTRMAKNFVSFIHLESLVNTTYSTERKNDKKVNSRLLMVYKYIDKFTAKRFVDHFHSITATVKNHYKEELEIPTEKITVIPRGRPPVLKDLAEKPTSHGNFVRIINVGRNEFQKGQLNLLKGILILIRTNKNFKLEIYGRDGEMTKILQFFITQNNLSDFVSLKGFSTDISTILLSADLFVFPSLYEGLGGALIEAQAAGLPIACNDIPVLHEVVKESHNAEFFDSHNPESIAEVLKQFIDDPAKRMLFGQRSFINFNEKFLEDVNNQKLLELYQKLTT